MKKPGIPLVKGATGDQARFNKATKENIEIITGQRGNKVAELSADAGLGDVIRTVNALLARLQQ